jgi:hypothetical protein
MRDLIRFFRVVPPVPSMLVATFTAVTAVAMAAVAIDPGFTRGMLDAVLVLQVFTVSSGFGAYARRGYYDLLLTRGERRAVVALVHWIISATPGAASWAAVAATEVAASGGRTAVGFAPGTIAALAVVSAVGWATTVGLPRFAGAIGWVVVVALGVALRPAIAVPAAVIDLVCPLTMVGQGSGPEAVAAVPAVLVAAASVVMALVGLERSDIPLVAAQ